MNESSYETDNHWWFPVTGCTPVSAGCTNCVAEHACELGRSLEWPGFENGFAVTCHPEILQQPLSWRGRQTVDVCSCSDLFHEDVPADFIRQVFEVMEDVRLHTFRVETKRVHRLVELADDLPWPSNVWMGVSVESGEYLPRIDSLRSVPAALRYVSFSPLIGSVGRDINLEGIGWVIVRGEVDTARTSNRIRVRPMQTDWARAVRDACLEQSVPFYFQSWGDGRDVQRELDGCEWHEMPSIRTC